MKKVLTVSLLFLVLLVNSGCSLQEQKQIGAVNQPIVEEKEQEKTWNEDISGTFGPYEYNNEQYVLVGLSNTFRALSYYENDNGYVLINDETFGPYKWTIQNLKVTNNFWWFIVYGNDAWNMTGSKKIVVINGKETHLENNSDNIDFDFSDEKDSWGIRYDDEVSGRRNFIVNGVDATEEQYNTLTKITVYRKDDGNYYVKVNDTEHLIWMSEDQESALFAQCMIYNDKKWGCAVGKNDNKWHIIISENDNKKEYGPYGDFVDPREVSEFTIGQDGFIFCSSRLAVVHKNGVEKKYSGNDMYQCNYSRAHFGFDRTDNNTQKRIINVDDKEYGPYDMIENFTITENGWWFKGFIAETDKSEYVLNWKKVEDINSIAGPALSDNYYALAYELDGKLYLKVEKNGQ
jgi:hypothetical protein